MAIIAAVFACLRKSFDFSGRAPRREFWSFVAFWLSAAVAASFSFHVPPGPLSASWALATIGAAPALLVPAALLVPLAAVAVRRLHDINLSGWWLISAAAPVPVLDLLVLGAQVVCFARAGTVGPNRYGPDPLLP